MSLRADRPFKKKIIQCQAADVVAEARAAESIGISFQYPLALAVGRFRSFAIRLKWVNPLKEFAAFDGKLYAASTRRVYLSAVKRALKIAGIADDDCESHGDLLAILLEAQKKQKLPRSLKIGPFLAFLDSRIPKDPNNIPDYEPIRRWVIDRISEETKCTAKASIFVRRDLAILACLCIAPEKDSPRRWPKSALVVTRQGGVFCVTLWDKVVKKESLALALLYWDNWRKRLDRPEQSRFFRKSWAYSPLLFPNSKGEAMTKHVTRNALLRLTVQGEGRVPLTTSDIRRAFLQVGE
jgi:hypothetical protein